MLAVCALARLSLEQQRLSEESLIGFASHCHLVWLPVIVTSELSMYGGTQLHQ